MKALFESFAVHSWETSRMHSSRTQTWQIYCLMTFSAMQSSVHRSVTVA